MLYKWERKKKIIELAPETVPYASVKVFPARGKKEK
jgi:hypothetical protein